MVDPRGFRMAIEPIWFATHRTCINHTPADAIDLGPRAKDSWRNRPPNSEPDIAEPVAGITED
jgi:hypothetical protein